MEQQATGRMQKRRLLIRALLAFVSAILLAVVGQWFVQVAQDKGLYIDAGERWDYAVSAIWGVLEFLLNALTSPVATHLAVLALGLAGGLIIDWRYFRRPNDDRQTLVAEGAPVESALAAPKPDVTLEEAFGRVSYLRGGYPSDVDKGVRFREQVELNILDDIKEHKLTVWGRIGQAGIGKISGLRLRHATLDYSKKKLRAPNGMNVTEYTDIRFSSAEIDSVWPIPSAGETEWEPTEQQIREECLASGHPLSAHHLTQARDSLIMAHHFNKLTKDAAQGEQPNAAVLAKPEPAKPERKPLQPQERGPCRNAIDQIHDFITQKVAAFHHELLAADLPVGEPQPLAGKMAEPLKTRQTLHIRVLQLAQENEGALKRLEIDLRPLRRVLERIEEPMKGLQAAHNYSPAALHESAQALIKASRKLGETAKAVDEALMAKKEEYFGEGA